MAKREKLKFGLVLSGGGARGAFEAGVLYYLRTQMPPEIAHSRMFDIYSGASVGAINTAFLTATAHDPIYQGAALRRMWQNLTNEDIYSTDVRALSGFLVKSGFFMATNFFGLQNMLDKNTSGSRTPFPFKNILDTSPFVNYLRRNVAWSQIHRNIERRVFDAVTISATHMMSGQLVLFVEKHADAVYRKGGPVPILGPLSPKHILASAAIPLVFPIIRINRQFYGDGSLRQNTPMSPAIHLGANRLLVISTHFIEPVVPLPVSPWSAEAEPRVGDVLSTLLAAIFMDKLDYDLEQMRRINYLISDMEALYGEDALEKINAMRMKEQTGHKEIHVMNKIVPFVIHPSQDIGLIASNAFKRLLERRETLTPVQKFFSKVMEGTPDRPNDLVSLLMFDREYLETLLQLGYEDARAEHDNLVSFFTGQPLQ